MTHAQRLALFGWLAALPLGFGAGPAAGQDDEPFDRTPDSCLSLTRIDRTRVLDDQTILFYMRDDRVYRNFLPRKCPGLAEQNRFSYESRTGRLCNIDTVTVLEQWAGRLEEGFTCRLGDFYPISPEEIEDLEALRRGSKTRETIEVQPVELPRREPAPAEPEQSPPSPAAEQN
jgi:Family of unknown function (DUF6491)